MFRMVSRIGLLIGLVILTLFIGAKLINDFDPYRILTEELIAEVAAEPDRIDRLNGYSSQAVYLRQLLQTEDAAAFANWMDDSDLVTLLERGASQKVKLIVAVVDTAVHKIADFDDDLGAISEAEVLSRSLAQLHVYDPEQVDVVLAELYRQSQAVSNSLKDVGEGVADVESAVSTITEMPTLETIQQEVWEWRTFLTDLASNITVIGIEVDLVHDAAHLADMVYWSIESWQGVPANMQRIKLNIDKDTAWLGTFEQRYQEAKVINDRWHFDVLRSLPPFVAENAQPLLLGLIGSLLLALSGWVGSREPRAARQRPVRRQAVPRPIHPRPSLAFQWADGRTERQTLPAVGELTIGNVVIKRARVRYYLERLDNAFPALLNGQTISGARTLSDGDVLQIGELQTVFQMAA